jgi:hypothetical protein
MSDDNAGAAQGRCDSNLLVHRNKLKFIVRSGASFGQISRAVGVAEGRVGGAVSVVAR